VRSSPLRRSGVDHTVLPANTPHLGKVPRGTARDACAIRCEWLVGNEFYSLLGKMLSTQTQKVFAVLSGHTDYKQIEKKNLLIQVHLKTAVKAA